MENFLKSWITLLSKCGKLYLGELGILKTLAEMRIELKVLEGQAIISAGLQLAEIDKH